jgi:hypothetical protein
MIKAWFTNLPKMIGLMLLALFVHTYLLVVINEDFSLDSPSWAAGILAVGGQKTSVTLIWTLLGCLASTAYYKLRRREIKTTLENVHSLPAWVRGSIQGAAGLALPILLAGGAAALLISFLFNNALISLQLALIMAGALIAQQQSLFVQALQLGWSDWNRSFKKDQHQLQFNIAWAGVAITGATLGSFLSTYLQLGSSLGFILILLVLGLVAIQVMKQRESRFVGILLILFYILVLIVLPAFADDGGWSEAQYGGGNPYLNWLYSQGASIAILMGLPPAIGAAIGAALGAAAAGIPSPGLPPPSSETEDGREDERRSPEERGVDSNSIEMQQELKAKGKILKGKGKKDSEEMHKTSSIRFLQKKDPGSQVIESSTQELARFDIRVIPVLDQGNSEVEVGESLIVDERREL